MSRVSYEFATSTATSWTHEITCDFCRVTVTRVGALPKRESEKVPRFEFGVLVGWASYSRRSKPNDPELLKTLDEDLWPREDRDFCPSCASVLEDLFRQWGIQAATLEERYLDALGRKIGGRNEALGVALCGVPDVQNVVCWRQAGHDGAHGGLDAGLRVCPCCFTVRYVANLELRAYTIAQLESHAVDQHSVIYEEGFGLRAAGWITPLEQPRVAYADVMSALRAEAKRLGLPGRAFDGQRL